MRNKKIVLILLCILSIFFSFVLYPVNTYAAYTLHSKYICLMDASSHRVLFSKDDTSTVPMASTTKIMTLIIALENCPKDYICTTSGYASAMPDVQLNAYKGEQFLINDLYYSLMLNSHNDTAEIIAENVAYQYICNNNIQVDFIDDKDFYSNDSSVLEVLSNEQCKELSLFFCNMMNKKCKELGIFSTYFLTPNGLDSEDSRGFHHSTAYDLAIIMSYCINNQTFLDITSTKSKTISDINNKHTYSLSNTNPLLNSMDGIISGKTGFTSKAGYCYVCAYEKNGCTFILVLLQCGYPPYKNYRWQDVRYILDNYTQDLDNEILLSGTLSIYVPVKKKKDTFVIYRLSGNISSVIKENENITFSVMIPDKIDSLNDLSSYCNSFTVCVDDKPLLIKTFEIIEP